jgi:hypothetical protein
MHILKQPESTLQYCIIGFVLKHIVHALKV